MARGRCVDLAVRHDWELEGAIFSTVPQADKIMTDLVPRTATAAPELDVLRGFTVQTRQHRAIEVTNNGRTRSTGEDSHLGDCQLQVFEGEPKRWDQYPPGKLPDCISFTPPLIAAVIDDTLYLLLPQVTVPEGRARGPGAATTAEAATARRERTLTNIF